MLMFFMMNLLSGLLFAVTIDQIKVGSVSEGVSSNFLIYRLSDKDVNDESETFPSTCENYANIIETQLIFSPVVLDLNVTDIGGDSRDEAVILRKDTGEDEDLCQVLSKKTQLQSDEYGCHFTLRGGNKLFVDDYDNNGEKDIVVGKIDGQDFSYQTFMNSIDFSELGYCDSEIKKLSTNFSIEDVVLIKSREGEMLAHYFVVYSADFLNVYLWDSSTLTLESVEQLGAVVSINEIGSLQVTKLSCEFNYNFFCVYEDYSVYFRNLTFPESDRPYSEQQVKWVYPEVEGYQLQEVYIPQYFEGRVATWFQSSDSKAGKILFFRLKDNGENFEFVQEEDSSLSTVDRFQKPQMLVYEPAYMSADQKHPGHMGEWVVIGQNNEEYMETGYKTYSYNVAPNE